MFNYIYIQLFKFEIVVNGLFKLYQKWSFKNVPLPIE